MNPAVRRSVPARLNRPHGGVTPFYQIDHPHLAAAPLLPEPAMRKSSRKFLSRPRRWVRDPREEAQAAIAGPVVPEYLVRSETRHRPQRAAAGCSQMFSTPFTVAVKDMAWSSGDPGIRNSGSREPPAIRFVRQLRGCATSTRNIHQKFIAALIAFENHPLAIRRYDGKDVGVRLNAKCL